MNLSSSKVAGLWNLFAFLEAISFTRAIQKKKISSQDFKSILLPPRTVQSDTSQVVEGIFGADSGPAPLLQVWNSINTSRATESLNEIRITMILIIIHALVSRVAVCLRYTQ